MMSPWEEESYDYLFLWAPYSSSVPNIYLFSFYLLPGRRCFGHCSCFGSSRSYEFLWNVYRIYHPPSTLHAYRTHLELIDFPAGARCYVRMMRATLVPKWCMTGVPRD